MLIGRIVPVVITTLFTMSAGVIGAQTEPTKSRPTAEQLHQRMHEQLAANRLLFTHLEHALSVRSVGFAHNDTTVELHLENWKRSLSVDTLAPIAREGLAVLVREDPSARRAKVLVARFSDYEPTVVTLTWSAADFKTHPERFRVTREK